MVLQSRLIVFLACFWLTSSIYSQEKSAADQTILNVEILTPAIGGNPLDAQRWREVFQQLGEGVRLRQKLGSDRPEVAEESSGKYRVIKITGTLDIDGVIQLGERKFRMSEVDSLRAFLEELKTYGAQGSPDGKPLWGLSEAQFTAVMKLLATPVTTSTRDATFKEAIAAIPKSDTIKVVVHQDAAELFAAQVDKTISVDVQGVSTGTALAFVLSQWGMGFQPLRVPGDKIELVVHSLSSLEKPWPIGWPVEPVKPRNQLYPKLFAMVDTGFTDVPLMKVLEAISTQGETPVLVNVGDAARQEIDLSRATVSYPSKRTALAIVLRSVVRSSRMNFEYRYDEAGTPFVYVFPFVPFKPASPQ